MYYTQIDKIQNFTIARKKLITDFLINRFKRIYPVYWVWTSIFIILWALKIFQRSLNLTFGDILYSYALVPHSADGIVIKQMIIVQGWTLLYEIYFYILFALSIFSRKIFKIIPFIFIAMVAIGTFLNLISPNVGLSLLSKNIILLEFIFGMFAAFLIKKTTLYKKNTYDILIIISVLNFLASLLFMKDEKYRVVFWGIPSFFLALGFVGREMTNTLTVKANILKKIFLFLGKASYSIYLTHSLGIMVSDTFLKTTHIAVNDFYVLIITLLLLFVFSIPYIVVEKRILKLMQ